jgi:hypothetical protein
VSSIEGKMLAKIYKCPFVEISALLGANVDTLWREVVRKLFKYMQASIFNSKAFIDFIFRPATDCSNSSKGRTARDRTIPRPDSWGDSQSVHDF